MLPYRPSPAVSDVEPWSPPFGTSSWSFSARFTKLLSRRELVVLALAIVWADLWSFGFLSSLPWPRFELVLGGWLALLVALAGRPRSARTFGSGLALAVLALAASAWRGGAGLAALACVAVAFVPAAARLRTFSVLEPIGSLLSFGLMGWPRGVRAAWQRARQALSGRKYGALPWLEVGVALGLLIVFGGLFTLANPFVRESAQTAFSAVAHVFARFDRLALRALGDLGMAIGFVGLLRTAPGTMLIASRETAEPTASARFVRMATLTLVSQNALFAVYNSIDVVFLGARVAPPGMTLQKYAHEGALWLTVTLAFVTAVAYAFRGAARTGSPLVRRLMNAWILQGLVLGVNVFCRLTLHVGTSGLSDTRFVGALGALAVVGGLGTVWWTIRWGQTRGWVLRTQATLFAAAVTTYALLPTHLLSAHYDVRAIGHGESLPLVHLTELARQAESAPVLLGLLENEDPIVREGVAALLLDQHFGGSSLAERRADATLATQAERMREMLRGSDALQKLAAQSLTERGEGHDLDEALAREARARFWSYVRYMDDQDAYVGWRMPENGALLIDPNASQSL